jgi:hypothetical protein
MLALSKAWDSLEINRNLIKPFLHSKVAGLKMAESKQLALPVIRETQQDKRSLSQE